MLSDLRNAALFLASAGAGVCMFYVGTLIHFGIERLLLIYFGYIICLTVLFLSWNMIVTIFSGLACWFATGIIYMILLPGIGTLPSLVPLNLSLLVVCFSVIMYLAALFKTRYFPADYIFNQVLKRGQFCVVIVMTGTILLAID